MSPSTPGRPRPRIPFQPNPFGSAAYGSPWADDLTDVVAINSKPFQTILTALRQMRAGSRGTSVVLTGEPGSGKTHLLGRLRRRLHQDAHEGNGATIYIYVRCNASAGTLWRHLRYALAADLMKGEGGSQLHAVLQSESHVENVHHAAVRRVLEGLRDGRHAHAAGAWLRGELLGESDLAALGLAVEREDEVVDRERDAKLVVEAILAFLAPTPVVLCFDQVEALETYRGEEAGFHALAQMISALNDSHKHVLLISCIVLAFEYVFDRLPNGADRDRWLQEKDSLRPIDWPQALALVQARLDNATQLKALRQAHAEDSLWPIDAAALQPLFATETGLCLPRKLIQTCKQQFAELMGNGEPMSQPPTPDAFLHDQYERNLRAARPLIARQGIGKTLSDCLPWLLQNSGMIPLGQDEARSRYAHQAWRGPSGDTTLTFCDGGALALTNQLKKVERHWNGKSPQLAILRDPAVKPGQKGAQLLDGLKRRGAKEVHPLPEALAALQAIRNLAATARSGELFFGDGLLSEQAVTDWALAHLPPEVAELRGALTSERPPKEDPRLPALAALVAERKIVKADDAAAELQLSREEVRDCARRHPLRFGLLDGPPLVLFEKALFEKAIFEAASAQAAPR